MPGFHLLVQPGVLDGDRGRSRELDQHGLIGGREIPLVLVREPDVSDVAAVAGHQRCVEVSAQRRMPHRLLAEAAPVGVCFELGLGQPHGPVGPADHRVDPRAIRPLVVIPPARIFLGERDGLDRLRQFSSIVKPVVARWAPMIRRAASVTACATSAGEPAELMVSEASARPCSWSVCRCTASLVRLSCAIHQFRRSR